MGLRTVLVMVLFAAVLQGLVCITSLQGLACDVFKSPLRGLARNMSAGSDEVFLGNTGPHDVEGGGAHPNRTLDDHAQVPRPPHEKLIGSSFEKYLSFVLSACWFGGEAWIWEQTGGLGASRCGARVIYRQRGGDVTKMLYGTGPLAVLPRAINMARDSK